YGRELHGCQPRIQFTEVSFSAEADDSGPWLQGGQRSLVVHVRTAVTTWWLIFGRRCATTNWPCGFADGSVWMISLRQFREAAIRGQTGKVLLKQRHMGAH